DVDVVDDAVAVLVDAVAGDLLGEAVVAVTITGWITVTVAGRITVAVAGRITVTVTSRLTVTVAGRITVTVAGWIAIAVTVAGWVSITVTIALRLVGFIAFVACGLALRRLVVDLVGAVIVVATATRCGTEHESE